MQAFLTYFISHVPLQEIQMRSGKVFDRQRPLVVIQDKEEEETPTQEETPKQTMKENRWKYVSIPTNQEPNLPQNEPSQIMKAPPYPKILVIKKPTT